MRRLGGALLILVGWGLGCGERASAPPVDAAMVARWTCPVDWVPFERGGCGPAVLLCGPDGGAAAGTCASHDPRQQRSADDGGTGFWLRPDGAIGGSWPESGDPAGPPPEGWEPSGVPGVDWRPAAGVERCPADWRVSEGGCDAVVRTDCPVGTGPIPGGRCTPTAADACPTSRFATLPVEAAGQRVVYVDPSEPAPGLGTAAAPFADFDRALAQAGDNGWVLLAAGEYRTNFSAEDARHVVGVCAARSHLLGAATAPVAVARGARAVLTLQGVTLSGGFHGAGSELGGRLVATATVVRGVVRRGYYADGLGSRTEVTGVVATGCGINGFAAVAAGALTVVGSSSLSNTNLGAGVDGAESRLTLRDSAVVGTRSLLDGTAGSGVFVTAGAARLERVAVVRNRYLGVAAVGGGSVDMTDVFIDDTDTDGVGSLGQSLRANEGGTLRGTRVTALRGRVTGAAAVGDRSAITLSDCVLRGTQGKLREGRIREGFGAIAAAGSSITLDRCLVDRNQHGGLQVEGGTLVVRDSVVAATSLPAGSAVAFGVAARVGGSVVATRVLITGSTGVGVGVLGAGSSVTLEDSVIRECVEVPAGGLGFGASVEGGGHVTLTRTRLDRNVGVAVQVVGEGSLGTLEDVIATNTGPQRSGQKGVGLAAGDHGSLVARRCLVAANHQAGVDVQGGAHAQLDECVVRDTELVPEIDGLVSGSGILCSGQGSLDARRVAVVRNHTTGLAAQGAGVEVRLADCAIEDTFPGTDDHRGGWGIHLDGPAHVIAVRTRIDRNVNTGVFVTGGGRVELSDVAVRDTRSGGPSDGVFGRGIDINTGGQVSALRALVSGNREMGVALMHSGSADLRDVIVAATAPVAQGFGLGLGGFGPVSIRLSRVAVVGVSGAGLAGNPYDSPPVDPGADGATIEGEHVFVRGVQPERVRMLAPPGPRVAYGVEVGARSRVVLSYGVITESSWGVHGGGGALRFTHGVISSQTQAAAAAASAIAAAFTFDDVAFSGNASDAVVVDPTLPEVSVPPPQAPCASPPCQ